MPARRPTAFISVTSEQRLRAALAGARRHLPCVELVQRILSTAGGGCSRQMAYSAIGQGERSGLLDVHRVGARKHYALVPGWRRPEPTRSVRPRLPRRRSPVYVLLHALGQMPAVNPGPLVPSLGVRPPDPEVMPAEIGELIDSLHQRFYRHACGVE